MNNKDRERLQRLWHVMVSIPFPQDGSGTKTSSMSGFVGFCNDLRSVRAAWGKVMNGMVVEGLEGWELGWDYEDPDAMLDALEEWVEQRKASGWKLDTPYSFPAVPAP